MYGQFLIALFHPIPQLFVCLKMQIISNPLDLASSARVPINGRSVPLISCLFTTPRWSIKLKETSKYGCEDKEILGSNRSGLSEHFDGRYKPKEICRSTLCTCCVMNGGDGPTSYAQNSVYQRGIFEAAKGIINEEITKKLDIQQLLLANSEPLRIADLGCSCGPNTFLAIQNIVEAIESKFQTHGRTSPEFQVFFNDQVGNDFNSLFASLPVARKYYASSVAGSFHDRLFPTASLHFVYSSCALHWLSKVPERVLDKAGTAWNQGRIHYTGAPKEVFEAYSDQFAMDIDSFLQTRAKELVPGGLLALALPAVQDVASHPQFTFGSELELLGSCLMDMAKMGIVSEAKVDAFNEPEYFTSSKELRQIIEGNGCFSIERIEILNNPKLHMLITDLRQRMMFIRVRLERLIEKHFGTEIIDQLFEVYLRKLSESPIFLNPEYDRTIGVFVLLRLVVN